MKRGDIVRAQLPRPAGSPGREQFGTRPAVVVQDESKAPNLSTVVVVPLTSRMSAARFAGSFVVQPSAANGLSVASVVLTHQVRALDRARIEGVIGAMSDPDMSRLDTQMKSLLGL
jgi:mRNA-degrading endonuclease toxin of MazEF toxin-antitoxin module